MKAAKIAWMIAIGILLGYEAYAVANATSGDTLSEAVWDALSYPFIPFAAGFVCGHFFWQRHGTQK